MGQSQKQSQQYQNNTTTTISNNTTTTNTPHTTQPWREDVPCQRFISHGPWQKYFEVKLNNSDDSEGNEIQAGSWQQAQNQIFLIISTTSKTMRQQTGNGLGSRDPSPWLRRTGWLTHLGGLVWADLHPLLEKPDEKEQPVGHIMWETLQQVLEISHG